LEMSSHELHQVEFKEEKRFYLLAHSEKGHYRQKIQCKYERGVSLLYDKPQSYKYKCNISI